MNFLNFYFIDVVLCVISLVICDPLPQQQNTNGKQDGQNQAMDFFATGLVENPRMRKNYLNCFLDNGPCSPEVNSLRQMVPDALQNECAHCTELQKRIIEKMMCYLNDNQPDIFKEVAAKFDPDGEYMKEFFDSIDRKGNRQFLNRRNPQQPNQQNPQLQPQQPNQQNPQFQPQQPNQQNPQFQPQQPNQQNPQFPPQQPNQQNPQFLPQQPNQNFQPSPQSNPQQSSQNNPQYPQQQFPQQNSQQRPQQQRPQQQRPQQQNPQSQNFQQQNPQSYNPQQHNPQQQQHTQQHYQNRQQPTIISTAPIGIR